MYHELRIYTAMPGKMGALNKRFAEVTTKIWARVGIKPIAFWEDYIGVSNRLTYILEWEDLAQRERLWAAFQADPEWNTARVASESDGTLVDHISVTIMRPTNYSPLK